ncbi:variable surface protein [Plasmodium gonderi]|uniref:Variable surface protein n=1 Tax=Plasmodium gonderi TaxID=77519 RepID=A0A1Y1JWF0_PLAGO|nr:variable surface protein [Plasmodium gonderi]GAW84184.1 variable surface protein [Plasmodium gonderi]
MKKKRCFMVMIESNRSDKTNEFYIKLINIVKGYGSNMCHNYKHFAISEDKLKKLNDLNDMNNMIYYVINSSYPSGKSKCDCLVACLNIYEQHHKTCESRTQSYFCEALNHIKDQYNRIPNLTNECINVKCNKLPCEKNEIIRLHSPRTSKSKTAMISTILILIIPVLLFIIYKFTLYNSCPHRGIKNIMNEWHLLKGAKNIMQNSEISRRISWNSSYNILYNSP